MKKYTQLLTTLLILFCLSCEDEIEVDFENSEERLIVDALIEVETTSDMTFASILIRKTAPFDQEGRLEGALITNITLQNSVTGEFIFYDSNNESGQYNPIEGQESEVSQQSVETSFFTTQNANYILRFDYKENSYIAFSNLAFSSPITIEQTTNINSLEREVTVRFEDIENQENYYIIEFDGRTFLTASDRFFENGEAIISFNRSLDNSEDTRTESVRNIGADVEFFNYFNAILQQSDQGDPNFQIPRTTIRGNIVKIENGIPSEDIDNFPLGYFTISEKYTDTIVIE